MTPLVAPWRRSRAALTAAMALALGACSTNPPMPSPATAGPASAQPSSAPSATPTPTASAAPTDDGGPIPTSTTTGWWGSEVGYYCHPPAYYRLVDETSGIGACFGGLFDPPNTVLELEVGQDLDIHMSVVRDGAMPRYPLPTSSDPLVIEAWFIADTATMTYRALSPGTARLMTTGSCLVTDDSPSGAHQVTGPCPVLEVRVGPIATDCTALPVDACRAAAAHAVLFGFDPADPGQRVVGWVARPGSGAEWPGCGRIFADVTLTLVDPDRVTTVTVGQREPGSVDPRNFGICTY